MADTNRRIEKDERICPECGGNDREEITIDHDTFWVCYSYTCDPQYHNDLYGHANAEEEDTPLEDNEVHDENGV